MSNYVSRRSLLFRGAIATTATACGPLAVDAGDLFSGDGEASHYLRHRRFTESLQQQLEGKDVDARRELTVREMEAILVLSEVLTDQIADADRSSSLRVIAARGLRLLGVCPGTRWLAG